MHACPDCAIPYSEEHLSCPVCGHVPPELRVDAGQAVRARPRRAVGAQAGAVVTGARAPRTLGPPPVLRRPVVEVVRPPPLEAPSFEEYTRGLLSEWPGFLAVGAAALLLGIALAIWSPARDLAESLVRSVAPLAGAGFGALVALLWFNNVTVALTVLGAGLVHRALPWLLLWWNALVTGLILGYVGSQRGAPSIWKLAAVTIPHAAFEVPALLLAGSLSLRVARWIEEGDPRAAAGDRAHLPACMVGVAGLLAFAAVIEAASALRLWS